MTICYQASRSTASLRCTLSHCLSSCSHWLSCTSSRSTRSVQTTPMALISRSTKTRTVFHWTALSSTLITQCTTFRVLPSSCSSSAASFSLHLKWAATSWSWLTLRRPTRSRHRLTLRLCGTTRPTTQCCVPYPISSGASSPSLHRLLFLLLCLGSTVTPFAHGVTAVCSIV